MEFPDNSIDVKMLDKVVKLFYLKVINDKEVAHFFENLEMTTQSEEFKIFLAYTLHGKVTYQGKFIKAVHSHLNITIDHFNSMEMHMLESFAACNVPAELVRGFSKMMANVKGHIIAHN